MQGHYSPQSLALAALRSYVRVVSSTPRVVSIVGRCPAESIQGQENLSQGLAPVVIRLGPRSRCFLSGNEHHGMVVSTGHAAGDGDAEAGSVKVLQRYEVCLCLLGRPDPGPGTHEQLGNLTRQIRVAVLEQWCRSCQSADTRAAGITRTAPSRVRSARCVK